MKPREALASQRRADAQQRFPVTGVETKGMEICARHCRTDPCQACGTLSRATSGAGHGVGLRTYANCWGGVSSGCTSRHGGEICAKPRSAQTCKETSREMSRPCAAPLPHGQVAHRRPKEHKNPHFRAEPARADREGNAAPMRTASSGKGQGICVRCRQAVAATGPMGDTCRASIAQAQKSPPCLRGAAPVAV